MARFSLHPVTSSDTGTFCGKDRRAIVDRIVDAVNRAEPASFGVYGGRRMGKTSILWETQERLGQKHGTNDTCVLVAYVDLGSDTPNTKKLFFQNVYRRISSDAKKRCRDEQHHIMLDNNEENCRLNSAKRIPELAFSDFAEAYADLMQIMRVQYTDVKVIILLDEIAHLSGKDWSTEVSANLRAFLTNRQDHPYCNKTMLVIAGTTKSLSRLLEKRGSPLENELVILPLVVFSLEDTRELATLYPHSQASDDSVCLLHELSGGHPIIAQYILKTLSESENSALSAENIERVARSFATEKSVFGNWADDLLSLEKHLYRKLAKASDGLSKTEIRELVKEDEVDDALYTLTYTGIAKQENDVYSIAGTLFRDWFLDRGLGKEKDGMTKKSEDKQTPSSFQLVVGALVVIGIFAATVFMLVWAAGQVSGTALIFIVIISLIFDLVAIIFVLGWTGVISRHQLMAFYNRILDWVSSLGRFWQGKDQEE